MQLQTRFESLQNIAGLFSFFVSEQLRLIVILQDQVTKLTKKYGIATPFRPICIEIKLLTFRACAGSFILKAKDPPQDILNAILSLEMSVCFPDVVTQSRTHDSLTLPVTVASNKCSFSKFKLLKIYLRAAISHDRPSDLRILSIEGYRFSEIDKRKVLEIFAQRKARKFNIL